MADENTGTLTDDLTAAFAQYEQDDQPSAAPADDQAPADDVPAGDAPADDDAQPVDEPAEEPDGGDEKPSDEGERADKPAEPVVEAPQNWAAEDREMFAKIPAEAQQFLLNRHKAMEGDYTRKAQEVAEYRREYEPVHQMFSPHLQQLRAQGTSPAQMIQGWAQIAQSLQNSPKETIQYLAQQNGVDLGELQRSEYKDPTVSKLEQELNFLKSTIQQREQSEIQARQSTLITDIQSFAEEKTEAGESAHPHFDAVMNDMVALARAERAEGREPKLQDLYDKAVWMNPSIRGQIITSQRQAEEKKRQEEARRKAAKAKAASKSVTGGPGGQTPAAELSLRDQLSQAFN